MGRLGKAASKLRRAASSSGRILAALGLNPGFDRDRVAAASRQSPDPIITQLGELLASGDYDAFDTVWEAAATSDRSADLLGQLLTSRVEAQLAIGKHDHARATAARLVGEYNNPQGYYYEARSYFLCADYYRSIASLQSCLFALPNHVDSSYLLANAAVLLGDREFAWRVLEQLARKTKRARTWLLMANLVESASDFSRLHENWRAARSNAMVNAFDVNVAEYLALGALRAGNYPLARQIWKALLLGLLANPHKIKTIKSREANYSSRRAEAALTDLNRILRDAGVPMFLVSGTLLGCIREGRLLGHDKDIDVGVWEDTPPKTIEDALKTSGLFVILASRSKEILRLRHANGVAVDIFYHFREANDYWHAGVKMKWHNCPFELVETEFLGETYLIPKDHDLYLRENYGDWRTPKIAFDSAFDTPNGEILNADEFAVYCFKMLASKLTPEDAEGASVYLIKLSELNEERFVAEFNRYYKSDDALDNR